MEQTDVAERVGVTQQTVSKWENGESVPKGRNVLPLANALGVNQNDLTARLLQEHNAGGPTAEALELDVRVAELEQEVAGLKTEWAEVRQAFRRLLGDG